MALRRHPAPILLSVLIGIALLFAGIDWYRHRYVRSDEDLLKLLPDGDATVFYARLDLLRKAGYLDLISANRSGDADYQAFLRETSFDYRRDLNAIAGIINDRGALLAVKGRFNWDRIAAYSRGHGGVCADDNCQVPAQKQIRLLRVQPNVLAVAIGQDASFSREIHPGQNAMHGTFPADPLWLKLGPHLLKDPSSLPVALRIFLISLQSAKSVVVSVAAAPSGSNNAFQIKLEGECDSAAAADTAKKQLQINTNMLKLELAREHQEPNPADLTGLLTSGTFDTSRTTVRGVWPVRKELLKAIQ